MFFRRSRSIAAAEAAVKQVLAPYVHFHGQPPRFWEDSFVLGCAAGVSHAWARLMYKRPLTAEESLHVVCYAVARASNLNPLFMAERLGAIIAARDPDYLRAFDLGCMIVFYGTGAIEPDKDDPQVAQAMPMASALASSLGGTPSSKIAAAIQEMFVHAEFKARHGN